MADQAKQRIISQIHRLHVKRAPLNVSAVKREYPKLIEAVYAIKPFWGWKQVLEDAGIPYKRINVELQDHCTCLICGEAAAILTSHLAGSHQLSPKEYREEYPGAELMAESIRAARMRAKVAIPHWEPLWSWEYALDRTWEFYTRGWSVSCQDIQRREGALYTFIWHLGRQWDEVLQALGLDPAEIRHAAPGEHLTATEVVRRLKKRSRSGKSVAEANLDEEDIVLRNAARRNFGSYVAALRAAGFDPDHVRLKTPKYGKEHFDGLKAEMKNVASKQGHERAKAAQDLKRRYEHLVFARLGNWRQACRRYGVKFEKLAVYPYATKEDVLYGLREWAKKGNAGLTRIQREDPALMHAAYRLFGSWVKAMKVTGVTFERKQRVRLASNQIGHFP